MEDKLLLKTFPVEKSRTSSQFSNGQKSSDLMEEARRLQMPTIALLHSDGDPSSCKLYPIPSK